MKLRNLNLFQKSLVLIGIPLVFEIGLVSALYGIVHQAEVEVQKEEHAKKVLLGLEHLMNEITQASTHVTMFMLLGREHALDLYHEDVKPIPGHFKELKSELTDDPSTLAKVVRLEKIYGKAQDIVDASVTALEEGDYLASRGKMNAIKPILMKLLKEIHGVRDIVREAVEQAPAREEKTRAGLKIALLIGLVLNIILAVCLAVYFNRGTTRRLSVLMDNARRFARGEELNPPIGGSDEIAHLDSVFKEMVDELERSRHKEKTIIENAMDVICSLDSDFVFTAVSPAAEKSWGYKPAELIGRHFSAIVPSGQNKELSLAGPGRGTTSFAFENNVKKADGAMVDVLWSARWSLKDKSLICIAHDITERKRTEQILKESEARIRLIIEHMPVGLVVLDESGRIKLANPAAEDMFAYKRNELTGRPLNLLFNHGKGEPDTFMQTIIADALDKTCQKEALTKQGGTVPVEMSITSFSGFEGENYLSVILDITERKEIERMKQEFVSMVSHDLRTPLTSIQLFVDMLSEGTFGELTESGQKKAAIAGRNSARLLTLVNELIEIERLESGLSELNLEKGPIRDICERAIESVQTLADDAGVSIELSDQVTGEVFADDDAVVRVLVNLLGNSLKFSPQQSKITVTTEESDEFMRINITDRGRGIPKDLQDTIFDRFRQVELKDRTVKKGSGLGLSICKAIVELHGGTIGVTSTEGEGSTFWFQLPLAVS